jgi:hypothetical protein
VATDVTTPRRAHDAHPVGGGGSPPDRTAASTGAGDAGTAAAAAAAAAAPAAAAAAVAAVCAASPAGADDAAASAAADDDLFPPAPDKLPLYHDPRRVATEALEIIRGPPSADDTPIAVCRVSAAVWARCGGDGRGRLADVSWLRFVMYDARTPVVRARAALRAAPRR